MSPEIVNLLTQLPIVAVFVWYSERLNRQFQEFLREERVARERQNANVVSELQALQKNLSHHDEAFERAVAIMKERTRPKSAPPAEAE